MNWLRARCIFLYSLLGKMVFSFVFSFFFKGLLSSKLRATFDHRNVDGRAPASWKGLQNTQDVQGHMLLSPFSSFVMKCKGSNSEAP